VNWIDRFSEQTNLTPKSVAVVCGEDSLSYQELDNVSNQVAQNLRAMGIGRGDVVALLDYRHIDFMSSMIGILKSGAAYMPLDPTHPSTRWLEILNEGQPKLTIVGDSLSVEQRLLKRKWNKDRVVALNTLLNNDVPISELESILLDDLAYVLFTSGSTGKPKGVMIEHRGMVNNMLSKVKPLSLDETTVIAQTASQCFDISVWQFLAALVVGGKVVIVPNEVSQSPEDLLNTLSTQQVTIWECVPSMLQACLAFSKDLPNLNWVLPTGEALSQPLVSSWFSHYPEIPLMNAYGPAECSDDVAFEPIYSAVDRVCIGAPVANAHLHVVNKQLALMPIGVVGELAVSGPVVGRGYLGLSTLTSEKFVQNPYAQDQWDQRMYLTGDLVRRLRDGRLEFVGRTDNQVKLRGFRIELGEIEKQILSNEWVREAVAIVHHDQLGEKRLVAYVVTHVGDSQLFSTNDLKAELKAIMPNYMVPSYVIELDSMPLTANGKIDRTKLPEPNVKDTRSIEFIPPEDEVEIALAGIWCDLLNMEQVGRLDDFFDSGGHSLLATQLLVRIRQIYSVEMPVTTVFTHSVLSDLANAIIELQLANYENEDIESLSSEIDEMSEEEIQRLLELEEDE